VEVNRHEEKIFTLVITYLAKNVGSVSRPVNKVIELAVVVPIALLVSNQP
jgi:hypothetical protein